MKRHLIKQLSTNINNFYLCDTKQKFDQNYTSIITDLKKFEKSEIFENKLVFKIYDKHFFNLFKNFNNNFTKEQILIFYEYIIMNELKLFQNCINYLEYLINRKIFFENLENENFFNFLFFIEKSRNLFDKLNYNIIVDKFFIYIDQRINDKVNFENFEVNFEKENFFVYKIFSFLLYNMEFNSSFLHPNLKQYLGILKNTEIISDKEFIYFMKFLEENKSEKISAIDNDKEYLEFLKTLNFN